MREFISNIIKRYSIISLILNTVIWLYLMNRARVTGANVDMSTKYFFEMCLLFISTYCGVFFLIASLGSLLLFAAETWFVQFKNTDNIGRVALIVVTVGLLIRKILENKL